MATTLLARSTPYRSPLRACERICTRCGILFRIHPSKTRTQHTECRDCR